MEQIEEQYKKNLIKAGIPEEKAKEMARILARIEPQRGMICEPNVIDKVGFVIKKILG